MIIKVCGMKDPGNIRQVAGLSVDWIGFVFYRKSPRFFTPGNGKALLQESLRIPCRKVGVFVNTPIEEMMETALRYKLDYLQLHGNESPDVCNLLKKGKLAVIKAFPVGSAEDVEQTEPYEGVADYFLFDTKQEGYGGSGKSFDWSFLQAYEGDTPFLLSGGIHPGYAARIRDFRHPRLAGIDLNSGFEISPGMKDTALLAGFIQDIKINNHKSRMI